MQAMQSAPTSERRFLFLQGPHGPFFFRLGRMLRRAGAQVWRVGFNAGDRVFWPDRASYLPYREPLANWADALAGHLEHLRITDIVLYGDARPIHAEAVRQARAFGLRVHVFEEGYLRPYWVSYERGGSNGHSRLMQTSVEDMRVALAACDPDAPLPAPAHWGDMRQHIFYGALYHWFVMFTNRAYAGVERHRELPVSTELKLYLSRLLFMPVQAAQRMLATLRIRLGGYPYHLALLQLEHDASFQEHSPFSTMEEFLRLVIEGFAQGAPAHHHLVIKAHPLETGRRPLRRMIRQIARQHGLAGRVHYLRGGKLARMLNDARTAVTVNSTAGQQVLWRGIPLRSFGDAVYDKPEFVSKQPLA
jgi:capsular polysaccharide export protein